MLRIRNRRIIKTKTPVYFSVLAITIGRPAKKIGEKQFKPGHRYISRMFFVLQLHRMHLEIFYGVSASA